MIVLAWPALAHGPADDTTALPPGSVVEELLSADEVHVYRAELDAGAWRLVVTQHGDDAAVTLVRPDGERLGPFDSPSGRRGTEAVLVVLDSPGTVAVEVRAGSGSSAGRCTLKLERLAASAVPAESSATAAARAYAAGDNSAHYRVSRRRHPMRRPSVMGPLYQIG